MQPKPTAAPRSDYQIYELSPIGEVVSIGSRMSKKLEAIPIPDLVGKTVLDVGCDFGFWTFLSANKGAQYVLGLDRNRPVRGYGPCDLIQENKAVAERFHALKACDFKHTNIGKQWHEFGRFDVVYVFSLYHHIYENCPDHIAIWFWLYRHCKKDGVVLWENPVDCKDVVSNMNISPEKKAGYSKERILDAAAKYFKAEYVGPALHEPFREVYRLTPLPQEQALYHGTLQHGAGGATKAFEYEKQRRMFEIYDILGYLPLAGSLNVTLDRPFDWGRNYYRAQVLDVKDRSKGLESEWEPRWARFYPVTVGGVDGHVFKFEGDGYPLDFIEVLSPVRLRSFLADDKAVVKC